MAHAIARIAALSLTLGGAAEAALPDNFDAACHGTTSINAAHGKRAGPAWQSMMRFDLPSHRWCGGSCVKADGTAQQNDSEVSFAMSSDTVGANQYAAHVNGVLNKRTLAITIYAKLEVHGVPRDVVQSGQCALRPYISIPR